LSLAKNILPKLYGDSECLAPDYGKIVSERHFDRLKELVTGAEILVGGESDRSKRFFAPTIIAGDEKSPAMNDEIFGPILPLVEIDSFDDGIAFIRSRAKPLAAYLFSSNKIWIKAFEQQVSAGGICIGDALVHLSNHALPFGGVGPSGMGRYHGHHSFRLFSHEKAVLKRPVGWDIPLRYPPYLGRLSLFKWLARFF
jgi:aldehyde dehydrogenase (NAD+)